MTQTKTKMPIKMSVGNVYNLSYKDLFNKEQNIVFIITNWEEDYDWDYDEDEELEFECDKKYYAMALSFTEEELKGIFEKSNMRFSLFESDIADTLSIYIDIYDNHLVRRTITTSSVLTEI